MDGTMTWRERYLEAAGLIPLFMSARDETDAVTQIDRSYSHGGGWHEFKGFKLESFDPENPMRARLRYPGDPPYPAVAWTKLRNEYVIVFASAWVIVTKNGKTFRCARID